MFYFNGCAGIANAAIIFIFLCRQHKKDLSEVVTSQRWSPCYYDTGMNRGVPSLVSFATMQATHAIISIQPFPFVILVITSSDSHSHIPPFPPGGNPRKWHSTAFRVDFPPPVRLHHAIPPDRNPRKRHSAMLQLDFCGEMRKNAMRWTIPH